MYDSSQAPGIALPAREPIIGFTSLSHGQKEDGQGAPKNQKDEGTNQKSKMTNTPPPSLI